jgi:tetratricopeptide (TPR) repeat protein
MAALGVVVAAAGLLWWRPAPSPQPPELQLEKEKEPALMSLVEKMRQRVLGQPRSAQAWGQLGEVFLANGYRDEAIPCFEQAARLSPREARWPYLQGLVQRQNNIDAACQCFQSAAALCQEMDARSFAIRLRYAEALLRVGRAEEARPLLEDLLRQEPENVRVHLGLGLIAVNADDWETALAHLLRCADSPMTRQRAATQLARVYVQKGDDDAAERSRKRARQLPRDAEELDPFMEDYAPFLVSRRALFLRAEHYLRAQQIPEAIGLLQALVAENPEAAEALVKLGMAWGKLGDYARAEAVLRQAVAVAPDMAQVHYFLCVALFHQAERSGARRGYEAAAEEARQTVRCKPDHAYAHLFLGLAQQKLGQPQAALDELRQAVRFAPESTDPHLHLGEALLAAGQKKEGISHLEKAVDVADEGDQRPRQALTKWQKLMAQERRR